MKKIRLISPAIYDNSYSMQKYLTNLVKSLDINEEELNIYAHKFELIKKVGLYSRFHKYFLSNFLYKFSPYIDINHTIDQSYAHLLSRRVGVNIITVHDLTPRVLKCKNLIYNYITDSIKKYDKIIAVSNSTKIDIINIFKINPDKISVIYNPIDSNICFVNKKESSINKIILIGDAFYKNIPRSLIALQKFKSISKKDVQVDWIVSNLNNYNLIKSSCDKLIYSLNIKIWFQPDNDLLSNIYKRCDTLLFPSLYEGFGWPIIDAFGYGLNVITSNYGAMKEVSFNQALYCNPYNVDSIVDSLIFSNSVKRSDTNSNLTKIKYDTGIFKSNMKEFYRFL